MTQTPLGVVRTTAMVDGRSLGEPDSSTVLKSGAKVERWTPGKTEVELLSGLVEPDLPEGYRPITGSWMALWQVRAGQDIPALRFGLGLAPTESVTAGWDGGQGLAALTVDGPDAVLTLGGSDVDELGYFAERQMGVPRRWLADLRLAEAGRNPDVGVERTGLTELTWRLPDLEAGESVELALAVAWGPPSEDEPGTWYAVQTTPGRVRRALDSQRR